MLGITLMNLDFQLESRSSWELMWRTLTKKPVGDVKDDKAWDAVREAHIAVYEVFVKFMLPELLIKLPKLWMLLKVSKLLKKIMKLLKKLSKLSWWWNLECSWSCCRYIQLVAMHSGNPSMALGTQCAMMWQRDVFISCQNNDKKDSAIFSELKSVSVAVADKIKSWWQRGWQLVVLTKSGITIEKV